MTTLQQRAEALGHSLAFQRRSLGRSFFNRPTFGWLVSCSCGWEKRVNDTRPQAQVVANDHARSVLKPNQTEEP